MNPNENNNRALERRLYSMFLLFAAVLLVSCLLASLVLSIRRERRNLDQRISDTAAYIAEMPGVRQVHLPILQGQGPVAHDEESRRLAMLSLFEDVRFNVD